VPVEGIAALLRDYAGTVPSRPYRARPLLGRELNPAPPTLKEDAVTAQPQGEARPRQITVRAVRCLGEGQDCDLPARYTGRGTVIVNREAPDRRAAARWSAAAIPPGCGSVHTPTGHIQTRLIPDAEVTDRPLLPWASSNSGGGWRPRKE